MSIDAINAVDFLPPQDGIGPAPTTGPSDGFAAWLDRELSNVNTRMADADTQLRQLAAGETDNLHQVMISLEEAKLSFQLALQVRNRLMEAYQDILRMQV